MPATNVSLAGLDLRNTPYEPFIHKPAKPPGAGQSQHQWLLLRQVAPHLMCGRGRRCAAIMQIR